MIPFIGIPILTRADLLMRLVNSIDYPVENLLVIRNDDGKDDGITEVINIACQNPTGQIGRVHVISHPNAGVSWSWNECFKFYPFHPFWMIAGNDIQFTPGDLELMAESAHALGDEYAAFFGNHGHSLFIVTQRGIKNVGQFDVNLTPAYLEDCDWMRRLHLAGEKYYDVQGVKAIHGEFINGRQEGSSTIRSNPDLAKFNSITHSGNFIYYNRKWGGFNEREKFATPFNDPNKGVKFVEYDHEIQQKNYWFLDGNKAD